jgi:hypothetical protein
MFAFISDASAIVPLVNECGIVIAIIQSPFVH